MYMCVYMHKGVVGFFGSIEVWIQGLVLARQVLCHLNHASSNNGVLLSQKLCCLRKMNGTGNHKWNKPASQTKVPCFLSFVESRRINKVMKVKGGLLGSERGKGRGGGRIRKQWWDVIKLHYMCVWKCHDGPFLCTINKCWYKRCYVGLGAGKGMSRFLS
jgi:hypothetical protein